MAESNDALRPVAFMVMPFRERPVPNPPPGAPATIDCDALWDKAFRPALEELGYLAIRADSEVGSVIVKDMLERLALAELVVADLTIPNGNVYYEVGMRHVAKETHCILVAAEWSRQLFDVDQMRSDRYPLKDGSVPESEAGAIKDLLKVVIEKKKDSPTPYYEFVKGKEDSTVFRDQVQKISDFQAQVATIRAEKDKDARRKKVMALRDGLSASALDLPEVAMELLTLVRDALGWEELLDYSQTLPPALQDRPFTKEQLLLAKSKSGNPEEAIAGLRQLVEDHGETAERLGLLGGRYKKLWRAARDERRAGGEAEPDLIEEGHLDDAIEHYARGMKLDLNEYYCASNLPNLLRARGRGGDAEEAAFVDELVVRACQRMIDAGRDDGWARPTLLGAAFRTQDVDRVKDLAREVARQGAAAWQLESMLADIDDAVAHVEEEELRGQLGKVRDQLRAIAARA